jgi:hypothetical protein
MWIGFLMNASHVSAVIEEVIVWSASGGALVAVLAPETAPHDVARICQMVPADEVIPARLARADDGRFLGILQRQCLRHPALMARAPEMLATFRAAFLRAVPAVSARNIAFYYALTLARKMYRDLYSLKVPADWRKVVAAYTSYAISALQTEVWPVGQRQSSTPRFART